MEQDYQLPKLPDLGSYRLPDINTLGQGGDTYQAPKPYVKPDRPTLQADDVDPIGFIKSLPKSVLNMTKQIFIDFPSSVYEAGRHYVQHPSDWNKDMELFMKRPGDTGDFLRRSVTDYYADGHLWKNFNEDPARILADAASVLDLVGVAGRVGGVARASQVAAKASEAGHAALLSNSARTMARIGDVSEMASKAAGWVDPLRVMGKGASFAFQKGLKAIGYGSLTPAIADLYNHIMAREGNAAVEADNIEQGIHLTPEQNDEVMRHLNLGEVNDIADMQRKGGPVAEAYNFRRNKVKAEEGYIKEHKQHFGMDDVDQHFLETKAKAVEHWSNENMDLPIPKEQAIEMIKDGVLDPTYNSMFRERKGTGMDLWEMFNQDKAPAKSLGRAEERLVKGEYITDIKEIGARQNRAFHQVKGKLDFYSAVKELLTQENKILVGAGPEVAEKAKMLGYRELPEAFYKWYWENYNKGTSVLVNKLKEAASAGLSQTETIAKLRKAWNAALATGDIERYAAGGKVYVPDYVAAWIGQELAPVSNLSQWYQKWQSRYKSIATVFNPRYWAPVLFGNALVATLYGLSPDMLKLGLARRGDLPPVLKQMAQHEIWLRDLNIFDRKAKTFGQAASMLDNIYKQGIFANEVLKDSYARSRMGIKTFFDSEADIAAAVAHFGAAPEAHAAALTKLSDLKDSIATNLIKTNHEYNRLKRLEDKMTGEMAHLMAIKQSNMAELSIGLDARKDKIGQVMSELSSSQPKYAFFVEAFNKQIEQIRLNVKARPELLDPAAILQSIDAGVKAVESGKPELLRYVVKHLRDAVDGRSPLAVRRSRLSVLQDMVGSAEAKVARETSDAIDKLSQTGKLDKLLPQLARDRMVASRAAEAGNRLFGSFDSLLPFEKKVVKLIVPFYTFTKAMTSLAFRFPFLYPKRSFIFSHLAKAWNSIMDDDEAFMPEWTKNYIPLFAHEDGSVTMVRIGSLSPFSNVKLNGVGDKPIPSLWDAVGQNPFLRVIMDLKGGVPEWSGRPLSPSDKGVRLDNGEVYEYTGTGFKRVIAQPSILKTLFGLFPQSQLADQLLHGYAQTDRGWLFDARPQRSPNGDVRYPKELIDRLLSLGVPTTTTSPSELERLERQKVYSVAKEFRREMRTASPERRAMLQESLRSWASQEKRAIERD